MSNAAPGWYDDGAGRQRWWDGVQWTANYAPVQPAPVQPYPPQPQPQHYQQPQYAQQAPYPQQPVPVAVQGRQANNMGVSYVRPQQGHSLTLWIILSVFLFIPVIWLIYYSVSPNHYWHA
ncbi:DUF2510 domain-containing protein [Herbiconiux sp. UC225_62]|uniref:DUF2510 domain-containing protein n=1 Tax=Herbiconiux sp. UC225_62 TaxID=3350168 RepID=UPI0036D2FEDE